MQPYSNLTAIFSILEHDGGGEGYKRKKIETFG